MNLIIKKGFILVLLIVPFQFCFTQKNATKISTEGDKGNLYVYWGWNRGWFSDSDIYFVGQDYDFVLKDVTATDRATDFLFETYFAPSSFTIPQYNFRVGYYFHNHWDISFGIDHMKYIMQNNQTVKIDGFIKNTSTKYDRDYSNEDILVSEDFITFEHTDGLNYINLEIRRTTTFLNTIG